MASFFTQVTDCFQGKSTTDATQPMLVDMLLAASKMQDLLKGHPLRTGMHTAVLAGSVAKRMGLPVKDVQAVVYASLIYDLGLARIVSDVFSALPPSMSEKQVFSLHSLHNIKVVSDFFMEPSAVSEKSESAPNKPSAVDPELEAALDILTPLFSQKDNDAPLISHEITEKITGFTEPVALRLASLPGILQQHPMALADIIYRLGLSSEIQVIVEMHHELCDGSGYPLGLKRHQIPVGARILAFVDTLESMLIDHEKKRHEKLPPLEARHRAIEQFIATQTSNKFDTDVIHAFQELIAEYPDLLRIMSSRDIEAMCRHLVSEREMPLAGNQILAISRTLSTLVDGMAPLYREGHSEKVAALCLRMAEQLGIGKEQTGELLIAALLHDIGMIAVPLNVLMKHGTLGEPEWRIIREHPHWTSEILRHIPGFQNVMLWAGEHHERLNGRGYPTGRKGSEISIGGRLIALADVFDALTTLRPYRTHVFEPLDALPIMMQGRFSQFDNQLTNLFKNLILDASVVG